MNAEPEADVDALMLRVRARAAGLRMGPASRVRRALRWVRRIVSRR